jgi:type IV pilus assembly protein PilC
MSSTPRRSTVTTRTKVTARGEGESAENVKLKPSAESRVIFLRSLAVMVGAGVPIDQALHHLTLQCEDKQMVLVCDRLASKISHGITLSTAFSSFPRAFTRLQMRMIQVGEKTGNIHRVLNELSDHEEKERRTVMKVKGSLTYPLFILVIATLMMIFIPPYIMKGLFGMIESSGVKPPMITLIVLHVTNFLRSPLFYFGFALITAATMLFLPGWVGSHRREVSKLLTSVPVLGKVYTIVGIARFARALSLQLDCGVDTRTALEMSGEASDNVLLEEAGRKATVGLSNGQTISMSLQETGFFPSLLLKMVQVGEESGHLPDLLQRTADIYEQDLDSALDSFTALLEPMVMMGMGLVVGTLVISTMLPMMQVLQHL